MNGPKFLILIDVAAKSDAKVFRAAAFANNLLKFFLLKNVYRKAGYKNGKNLPYILRGLNFATCRKQGR